jgi:hypothetical protein
MRLWPVLGARLRSPGVDRGEAGQEGAAGPRRVAGGAGSKFLGGPQGGSGRPAVKAGV